MNTKYFIYIPSKGRSSNCLTAKNLITDNVTNFKIVIEPQDLDNYSQHFSNKQLLSLNQNNKGIGYSRQFIKEYAKEKKQTFHWQLDDDLNFKKRINNKNVKFNSHELLNEVEDYIDNYTNIMLAGLRNSVFAWTQTKPISLNKQIASCVLLNSFIESRYRSNTVEDIDFSMQVLTEGYCSIIFNELLYDNPPPARQKGGNSTVHYKNITSYQQNFIKEWGDDFKIEYLKNKSTPSRLRPRQVWRKFKQQPLKK